ncbi:MAG: AEC family transporter [Novosphingobium sp.]
MPTRASSVSLALAVLGPAALPLTLIASIITVCAFFAIALIIIEAALQAEAHPAHGRLGRHDSRAQSADHRAHGRRDPLALGVPPPGPVERFVKLLGSAASPCALVALGLFLAEKRKTREATFAVAAQLIALKLVVHPLVTWLLAAKVFHLAPPALQAAVLIAALPTGTGSFMVAEHYKRDAGITSRVVLGSTILSVATTTLVIALLT